MSIKDPGCHCVSVSWVGGVGECAQSFFIVVKLTVEVKVRLRLS